MYHRGFSKSSSACEVLIRKAAETYLIECTVIPKSKEEKIVGVVAGSLKVKLTAAPTDGKANKQLLGLLAKEFRIRQSMIQIVKGETSRHKTLAIDVSASLPDYLLNSLDEN